MSHLQLPNTFHTEHSSPSLKVSTVQTTGGLSEQTGAPEQAFARTLERRMTKNDERKPDSLQIRTPERQPERSQQPGRPAGGDNASRGVASDRAANAAQTQRRREQAANQRSAEGSRSESRSEPQARAEESSSDAEPSGEARATETTAGAAENTGPAADAALPAAVLAAMPPKLAAANEGVVTSGEGTTSNEPPLGETLSADTPLAQLLNDVARQKTQPGKAASDFALALQAAGAGKVSQSEPGQALSFAAATPTLESIATARNAAPTSPLMPDASFSGLATFGATLRTEQAQMPQMQVPTPAGQATWAEDVGNRVMWMVGRNDSKAELILTPAHLGKLEVSIQIEAGQTTAHFVAATAAARDALEQSMPRLREMLEQAGINLGQTDVSTSSEQQARQGNGDRQSRGMIGSGQGGAVAADGLHAPAPAAGGTRGGTGMVDIFA